MTSHRQHALSSILADQVQRHPSLQLPDLYKLLHQACMGSEHAVSDEDGARAWLEKELAIMGNGAPEPLLDAISPWGEIVRVHLRPYVEEGHDPKDLLAAFVRTGREHQGSATRLAWCGEVAEQMALAGLLPFPAQHIAEFMQSMEQRGFPALHHSRLYVRLYRPAYRVVARAYLQPQVRCR